MISSSDSGMLKGASFLFNAEELKGNFKKSMPKIDMVYLTKLSSSTEQRGYYSSLGEAFTI